MLRHAASFFALVSIVSPVFGMEIKISDAEKLHNVQKQGLLELAKESAESIYNQELEQDTLSQDRLYKKLDSETFLPYLRNQNGFSKTEREEALGEILIPIFNDLADKINPHEAPCMKYDDLVERYVTKIQGIPVSLQQPIKACALYRLGNNYLSHLAQSKTNEIIPQIRKILACGPTIGVCSWILGKHPDVGFTNLKKTKLTSICAKIEAITNKSCKTSQQSLYDFIQRETPIHKQNITDLLNPTYEDQTTECISQMHQVFPKNQKDIKLYDSQMKEIISSLLDNTNSDGQFYALEKLLQNHIKALPEAEDLNKSGMTKDAVKRELTNALAKSVLYGQNLFAKYVQQQFNCILFSPVGSALTKINNFNPSRNKDGLYFPQPLNDIYWAYKLCAYTLQTCDTAHQEWLTHKKTKQEALEKIETWKKVIQKNITNIQNPYLQCFLNLQYSAKVSETVGLINNPQ